MGNQEKVANVLLFVLFLVCQLAVVGAASDFCEGKIWRAKWKTLFTQSPTKTIELQTFCFCCHLIVWNIKLFQFYLFVFNINNKAKLFKYIFTLSRHCSLSIGWYAQETWSANFLVFRSTTIFLSNWQRFLRQLLKYKSFLVSGFRNLNNFPQLQKKSKSKGATFLIFCQMLEQSKTSSNQIWKFIYKFPFMLCFIKCLKSYSIILLQNYLEYYKIPSNHLIIKRSHSI